MRRKRLLPACFTRPPSSLTTFPSPPHHQPCHASQHACFCRGCTGLPPPATTVITSSLLIIRPSVTATTTPFSITVEKLFQGKGREIAENKIFLPSSRPCPMIPPRLRGELIISLIGLFFAKELSAFSSRIIAEAKASSPVDLTTDHHHHPSSFP